MQWQLTTHSTGRKSAGEFNRWASHLKGRFCMPSASMLRGFVLATFTLLLASPSLADWGLSSETKALIEKADAGDAEAQFRVGSAYDTGTGAPRSGGKAMKYYLMAAQQGNAEAQNSVGSVLQAKKQYSEALTWYERASVQGHALATNNLAQMYDLGMGVAQDRRKGLELYTTAADLGSAESMWNIANLYGAGQLGAVDMMSACVWTMRARKYASAGDDRLQAQLFNVLPHLARTLAPSEMEDCKQRANAWTPSGETQSNAPGDAP